MAAEFHRTHLTASQVVHRRLPVKPLQPQTIQTFTCVLSIVEAVQRGSETLPCRPIIVFQLRPLGAHGVHEVGIGYHRWIIALETSMCGSLLQFILGQRHLGAISHRHLIAFACFLHLLVDIGRFLTVPHHCSFYGGNGDAVALRPLAEATPDIVRLFPGIAVVRLVVEML